MNRYPAWERAYHDLWCPSDMRAVDPEGCGIGLALGYVWFPLVVLLAVATAVHLAVSAHRARTEEQEEDTPRDLHR